jgi:anti-anti-sigma factor
MATHQRAPFAAFIREPVGDEEYVRVFGDIDLANTGDLRLAIAQAVMENPRVVVDLSKCTYIGSHGIAVIAQANAESPLRVIASPQIRRVFDIAGLSELFVRVA